MPATSALQLVGMGVSGAYAATATASSTAAAGLAAAKAVDGIAGASFWSSVGHGSANATEWLQVDLGSTKVVRDVYVTPREDYGFPEKFTIAYSTNGTTWLPLPGQAYRVYPSPAGIGTYPDPIQKFHIFTPVSARYLRITATELRPDNLGTYYFQVADIAVFG